MNEIIGSPPTKKIRLVQESSSIPNAGNKHANKQHSGDHALNKIFEWKEEKVKLLIFGFVRDYIAIAIPDISSIIYYYLSTMLFGYHINNNKYSTVKYMSNNDIIYHSKRIHRWTTAIFTHYISNIFNNYLSSFSNSKSNENITKITHKINIISINNNDRISWYNVD